MKTALSLFACAALTALASQAFASESATGTIALISTGGTPGSPIYNYEISVHNTGTQNLSTFWYAWTPPNTNYLTSSPTITGNPGGWYGYVTSAGGADGYGLEWYNLFGSPLASDATDTFDFSTPDTPAQLLGNSQKHPGTPTQISYVYGGIGQSDLGTFFIVSGPSVAPEPATLTTVGLSVLALLRRRSTRR